MDRRRAGVSTRVLVLGFALIPLNVFFITGFSWLIDDFTGWSPIFANTLTIIFALALLNPFLRRWRPGWAFSPGEMLTLYVLIGISTGLISVVWAVGGVLAGVISYPFWFATPSNDWEHLLWPNLPHWLTVRDRGLLEGFFVGASTAYRWEVAHAWATPAFWWASFVTALMWVCLCLNSIVRRRWADEEKLPFPLVTVPVQVADERLGLLKNKVFWVGFGACLALHFWNLLSSAVPSVPGITLHLKFFHALANKHPWDKLPYPVMNISPWSFALIYLIPLDMAFSLFFFDLMWNVQYALSAWFGWSLSRLSGFPYGQHQSAGGLLAVVAAFCWLDRRYFAEILKRALGLRSALQSDRDEAFSFRAALLGVMIGCAYLWWFLNRAGMQHWLVGALLSLYFASILGLVRMRAQVGPPAHDFANMMPDSVIITALGTRTLGTASTGMLSLLEPYLGQQGNNPVPLQQEAFKMAEGGRMERRRIALAMALVVPLTVLCYFWVSAHYGYQLGLASGRANREMLMSPRYIVVDMDNFIRNPSTTDTSASAAMGFGFAFTILLMHLKLRFAWWPIHPAAFPICLSWAMQSLMLPLFVVWLFKLMLLRYGGLRAHRRALPFFIGVLVGTTVSGMFHGLLFRVLGVRW
jgi:hypothetical protein